MKDWKENNKGFSLVELIIVMAIMAILVGTIAPQVFKYVEASREAKDIQIVHTVFTALQTAIAEKDSAPSTISGKTLDEVIGSGKPLENAKKLLGSDMDTVAKIQAKAKSKKGKAGTLYVDYEESTGKLSVYIGSAAGTTDIGPVTN